MTNDIMSAMEIEIERLCKKWTNSQEVLLRAGEMSAQELRTAMAVLHGCVYEIRTVMEKYRGAEDR